MDKNETFGSFLTRGAHALDRLDDRQLADIGLERDGNHLPTPAAGWSVAWRGMWDSSEPLVRSWGACTAGLSDPSSRSDAIARRTTALRGA